MNSVNEHDKLSHLDTLLLIVLYPSNSVLPCSAPSKINGRLECSGQILTNSFKLKLRLPKPDKNEGVVVYRARTTGEEEERLHNINYWSILQQQFSCQHIIAGSQTTAPVYYFHLVLIV